MITDIHTKERLVRAKKIASENCLEVMKSNCVHNLYKLLVES